MHVCMYLCMYIYIYIPKQWAIVRIGSDKYCSCYTLSQFKRWRVIVVDDGSIKVIER